MARDIVCDMAVDEEVAADNHLMSVYKGQTYYFCSTECKQAFDAQPVRYTEEKPAQLYAGAPAMPMPDSQMPPAPQPQPPPAATP